MLGAFISLLSFTNPLTLPHHENVRYLACIIKGSNFRWKSS